MTAPQAALRSSRGVRSHCCFSSRRVVVVSWNRASAGSSLPRELLEGSTLFGAVAGRRTPGESRVLRLAADDPCGVSACFALAAGMRPDVGEVVGNRGLETYDTPGMRRLGSSKTPVGPAANYALQATPAGPCSAESMRWHDRQGVVELRPTSRAAAPQTPTRTLTGTNAEWRGRWANWS